MTAPGISRSMALAWMLARRDVQHRYASSYLGFTWSVGVPFLYALINVVVFSVLMSGRMGPRYSEIPFALFYFVPFTLWGLFSEVVGRSTQILREYHYLISKIAFPYWVLPLIPLASALLTQAIIWVLISVLMLYSGIAPAYSAILYVPIWMISLLLTVGVAALSVYVPDLAQVVPVVLNILFWLTPLLYPASLVEDHGALWLRGLIMDYNPFFYLVEFSRHAVFGSAAIDWTPLLVTSLFSTGVLGLGLALFQKLKPGFSDVI
jgi:lipopolysaccharide transport system permease protein